jgi:hypothetical protein
MVRAFGVAAVVSLLCQAAAADDDVVTSAPPAAPSLEAMQARLEALEKTVAAQASALADAQATAEAEAATPTPEPAFEVHGFIDMGLQKAFTNAPEGFPTTATTFVLGNINLYFAFHPAEHWSALTEVRFTNDPNGVAYDPANGIGDDTMRWGATVLERAYIEYDHSRELGVRVGEFLTPFGIWNVDHGSPTVIPIVRPESITQELFPAHQLGVDVFGEVPDLLPDRWTLAYHAYVSNGRTPGSVDLTDDKMFGGRLMASTTRPYRMAFGVSAMYGTYSDHASPEVAYSELGYAADASLDAGAWRLRGELTVRDIDYVAGKHMQLAAGEFAPNDRVLDAYVLAAYRIPETRYEPFVYTELYRVPDDAGDIQAQASIGMTTFFTPSIQLKVQALHARFFDSEHLAFSRTQESETYVGAKLVMGL